MRRKVNAARAEDARASVGGCSAQAADEVCGSGIGEQAGRRPEADEVTGTREIRERREGKTYYGLVEVRRDLNAQRLYIHEAVLRDTTTPGGVQSAAATGRASTQPHGPDPGAIAKLLHETPCSRQCSRPYRELRS